MVEIENVMDDGDRDADPDIGVEVEIYGNYESRVRVRVYDEYYIARFRSLRNFFVKHQMKVI